ncbi:MAG: hypothetical protein GY800_01900 [Planctomycetes bacterium]|nr:hypothetical protein [Planctomycetota bacterium]
MAEAKQYFKGTQTIGAGTPLTFEYMSYGKEVTVLVDTGESCILSTQNPNCQVKATSGIGDPSAEVSLDISDEKNTVTVNYSVTWPGQQSSTTVTGTLGSWQL